MTAIGRWDHASGAMVTIIRSTGLAKSFEALYDISRSCSRGWPACEPL